MVTNTKSLTAKARIFIEPRIYLDTNVILDAIPPIRWQSSADLIERIKKEHWKCFTSRYTFMEILDTEHTQRYIDNLLSEGYLLSKVRDLLGQRRQKEHGLTRRDLADVYAKVYDAQNTIFSCISFEYPKTETYWDKADEFCAATNIEPDDALHLSMAIEIGCNILVTRDKDFRAIADDFILAILPEQIDVAVNKLNRTK